LDTRGFLCVRVPKPAVNPPRQTRTTAPHPCPRRRFNFKLPIPSYIFFVRSGPGSSAPAPDRRTGSERWSRSGPGPFLRRGAPLAGRGAPPPLHGEGGRGSRLARGLEPVSSLYPAAGPPSPTDLSLTRGFYQLSMGDGGGASQQPFSSQQPFKLAEAGPPPPPPGGR